MPAAATHGGAAPAGQPLPINPREPINVDCKSGVVNYKGQTMICSNIVISQGSTRVTADHARGTGGVNFQNSHWIFTGNVHIEAPPRGSLRSDQATVEFRNNRITSATVDGSPAEFEQELASGLGMEKGHADQIVYDVTQGTVVLTKDAWVSDGHNEMSAPSISYSIREQKVLANSPGASQGVHILITPQSVPKHGSPPKSSQQNKGAAAAPAPAAPHAPGPEGGAAPPPQGRS
ncbi:MAG: lipopolysaccharide transport periplasmic protein LptA, partial [Steroidobacteraceae bacterium]